jgi:tRNA-dihydrouridine synthase B
VKRNKNPGILKIGKIKLSVPCILAPLTGVSDLPFRLLNRSFGCQFAFREMISANSLVYHSKKTDQLLSTVKADTPLGLQLLGETPETIAKALDILAERKEKFDLVDLNAACPVRKVTKRGEGAGLLKNPRKIRDILKVMVAKCQVPVTVKIRAGWDERSVNAVDVALYAQEAGIKALFIHGRTKEQGYTGKVDYEIIRKVKDALDIPVIASGDNFSPQLVKQMFDETHCDGVAIARGAMGNPWIFRQTAEYLKGGNIISRPDLDEIIKTMLKHLGLNGDFYGDQRGTMIFRKFFIWYTKGLPGIKPLRQKISQVKTQGHMSDLIKSIKETVINQQSLNEFPG